MYRVRLIHWNAAEAREKADHLRSAGYAVEYDQFTPSMLREREDPPNFVVIDLSRLPSQGRDVAMALILQINPNNTLGLCRRRA